MSWHLTLEHAGSQYAVHHPQPEHSHEAEPYETQLIALDDSYMLTCSPESGDEGLRCRFSVGLSEWGYVISSRYLRQYAAMMPGFTVDPRKQLIEVGAGVSEAVVCWANRAANLPEKGPKPIVIDPANYRLIADMVDVAINLAPQERHIAAVLDVLRDIKQRCAVILDPDRVVLLPVRLQDAFTCHPELRGVADVVVDCYAAATYIPVSYDKPDISDQRRRVRERLYAMEQSFLKPGGEHFTVVPAHHS